MTELLLNALAFFVKYSEIIGVILSLIYLMLCIFQNNWCWLFGGLGSALYIVVFYRSNLYADMSLQFFYVVISFYGWYNWKFGKHDPDKLQIAIVKIPLKQVFLLSGVTVLIFGVYAYVLATYTNSRVILLDSFTTATALVATYMVTKKYLENWLVFILSDALCIGLCWYKGLHATALLNLVYTIMAIWGYFDWLKEMKKQNVVG
jgi:nicotinamide mononucleotide transporter